MTTSAMERDALRAKQIKDAEELLALVPQRQGVAKSLFWGKFVADWIFPYPRVPAEEEDLVQATVESVRAYCDAHLDPRRIDREADISRDVIDGLARLGVLGLTAPSDVGGHDFSQLAYGRVLELIGGRCSATAIFLNAHHSIGMRALLLFGTKEQQQTWLPDLVAGRKLAAFALTETQAGSDAGNVQTLATPSADGSTYTLNGEKRYITNGAIADVLTVMARTPVGDTGKTAVTAFLVTPDMPGFEVVEPRMEKLGIRGTATARLAFRNLRVPATNILGPLGKGLKVALTVLDFGRTTFGACCTGAAKESLRLALAHAQQRRQFGRALADFELVQQKLARMAAWTYAMEAMTRVTAGLIDRGLEDYMVETAMLKVWSTERLWQIVNDAFQIHGGAAYFTDCPLERMLRDARINQIGEGANEVLLSFIALSGLRGPAMRLKDLVDVAKTPWRGVGRFFQFVGDRWNARWKTADVPVAADELRSDAARLARLVAQFGTQVQSTLIRHREEILDRQLVQEPIAWAAMELYAAACALSRRDAELAAGMRDSGPVARLAILGALDAAEQQLNAWRNLDTEPILAAARSLLTPSHAESTHDA